ncbi:hypothetical protein T05_5390 [Trichinella murrelli]|uniref:Uncharacterized protein n=1 Tax=Trichinella murrelli TaxID=144512 RepID=A0A0V0TSW4_9BILA|nr:hypothetical protein T05_5390 [Trichinella murrelli]
MTVSEAFLPLLAERFPEILALRATSMCRQGQALKTTCENFLTSLRLRMQRCVQRLPSQVEDGLSSHRKKQDQVTRAALNPPERQNEPAKVSTTVRHLANIGSCPFCKDARDAANCTELRKTDVQTPSMAVKKWPPGKSLQSELKMFNVWMWGSSSWASAPAAVAVPGHVI